MAKKQLSFAEKAAKQKSQKDSKTVKFVKSERSKKTGSWRFNESFIKLASNENIDQALARIENEIKAIAKEITSIEVNTPEIAAKPEEKVAEVIQTEKTEPPQPAQEA